jgi:hypothetical protein
LARRNDNSTDAVIFKVLEFFIYFGRDARSFHLILMIFGMMFALNILVNFLVFFGLSRMVITNKWSFGRD